MQRKTPGVYVSEHDAFPNAVASTATTVPAFVSYTQKTRRDGTDTSGVPAHKSPMEEFRSHFGDLPEPLHHAEVDDETGGMTFSADQSTRFLLHNSTQLFYGNGG